LSFLPACRQAGEDDGIRYYIAGLISSVYHSAPAMQWRGCHLSCGQANWSHWQGFRDRNFCWYWHAPSC